MAIDTTIGGENSNSYVTLEYANDYFKSRQNAESWDNIARQATAELPEDTRKEYILIQATREIDRRNRFQATKYDADQELEFPRSINLDSDSALFIPEEIKMATCEQSLWILNRGGLRTNAETGYVYVSPILSSYTKQYLHKWITRQIDTIGSYRN